uniref:Sulfate transport system permease protein CysT n=1 Tax=Pedinomonas tuberculata TaxID=160064 RepID=A0A097KL42_9CHLO|nr:probable transport protein [Pedinomonas tuberculata]AIT93888.1 probable transport protein [Pedinomonas tuberculata]
MNFFFSKQGKNFAGWGFFFSYLFILLILPLVGLLIKSTEAFQDNFLEKAFNPIALSSYWVTFSIAGIVAFINMIFGFLLAWILIRYDFPGKKLLDAAVDLPFALPTSVAGLTLTTIYSQNSLIGNSLENLGIQVVFTRLGIAVAMLFVSFPFVVRSVQPILQEIEPELEEAAMSLGASQFLIFQKILIPAITPSLITGVALAFSRAIGEFGSVVIIASNIPLKDLISPVLIFQSLEQYDTLGATVVGTVMLILSLVLLLIINFIQSFTVIKK